LASAFDNSVYSPRGSASYHDFKINSDRLHVAISLKSPITDKPPAAKIPKVSYKGVKRIEKQDK